MQGVYTEDIGDGKGHIVVNTAAPGSVVGNCSLFDAKHFGEGVIGRYSTALFNRLKKFKGIQSSSPQGYSAMAAAISEVCDHYTKGSMHAILHACSP